MPSAPQLQAKIAQAVQEALAAGSRQLRITFKREITGSTGIYGLLLAHNDSFVQLPNGMFEVLKTAADSARWERDEDRTIVVTLLQKLNKPKNQEWLLRWAQKNLEKIEVAP